MTSPLMSSSDAASLRRRLAALLVVRASGHLADEQRRYPRWELANAELRRLLADGVGGVILLGGSAAELRLRTRQLLAWAGGGPLLLCADVEEGVGQRFGGASWLAPPLALGRLRRGDPEAALNLARRYGRCTGREARRLGLNWVLGPVCDVNNNPANPVINVRAWGEDPTSVADLAEAFCRAAQAEGVLCCAKHFPGHGDTACDSHLELPLLPHGRERLEAIELPPFRRAIGAGVASVMTAHLLLPALDPDLPATLSPAVLEGLLRRDLGFDGLIVTDALVMEAIAGRWGAGEAAVLALAAGADLVLMPADAEAALDAIVKAGAEGRLSEKRLEASLERRRLALAQAHAEPMGLDPAAPLADLSNGPLREDLDLARELLARSLETQGPPWAPTGENGLNLIRVDSSLGCPFLAATAPALELPAAAGLQARLLDGRCPSPWSGDPERPLALERLGGDGPVLVQLFVRGNPFRASAGSGEPWAQVLRQLLAADRLGGLAVLGSPYLWEELRALLPPRIPAAYSPAQMPEAQRMLLTSLGLGHAPTDGEFTD
jgi:beta-glucosidase